MNVVRYLYTKWSFLRQNTICEIIVVRVEIRMDIISTSFFLVCGYSVGVVGTDTKSLTEV